MKTDPITKLALKEINGPTSQDLRGKAEGAEQSRPIAVQIVRQIIAKTLRQAGADASEVEALWHARAALAEAGQWLCRMTDSWRNFEGHASQPGSAQTRVLELFNAHLAEYANAKATVGTAKGNPWPVPEMEDLAQTVIRHQAAALGKEIDVVELGRSVRATLSHAGFLVCRASAALWQAAGENGKGKSTETPGAKPPVATEAEFTAYIDVVRRFADELRRLNVDPTNLPVGSIAPAEAEAVRFARDFLVKRHRELRRWTHPETCVSPWWSNYAEQDAERGEDLLLHFYLGDSAPLHPNSWTWRGGETDPTVIGDMLCALMHAADALEIDFDAALGSAQGHYEDQMEMARTGIS